MTLSQDLEPNLDEFVRTFVQIEREPERWYQRAWMAEPADGYPVCGTAYCFAGWVATLNGAAWHADGVHVTPPGSPYGYREPVSHYACRVLGIPHTSHPGFPRIMDDERHLFDAGNTLADLYSIAASYLSIPPAVLREKVAAELGRLA